jgi:hypothetical protein
LQQNGCCHAQFSLVKRLAALISAIEGFRSFENLSEDQDIVMPIISSLAKTILEAMDHAWRMHCDVMQAAYRMDAAEDRRNQEAAQQVKRVWFGLL